MIVSLAVVKLGPDEAATFNRNFVVSPFWKKNSKPIAYKSLNIELISFEYFGPSRELWCRQLLRPISYECFLPPPFPPWNPENALLLHPPPSQQLLASSGRIYKQIYATTLLYLLLLVVVVLYSRVACRRPNCCHVQLILYSIRFPFSHLKYGLVLY